jgi:hypothetical protein
MDKSTFIQPIADAEKKRREILDSKGAAYAGHEDVFNNFKRNAERIGASKYQVLLIYLNKHMDAIINAIKDNPDNPVDKTEGMMGRIDDAKNYLDLLRGMLCEDKI